MPDIGVELDRDAPRSLASQLAHGLATHIRAGRLRPGERLPAELALTEQFNLSRDTVRKAIARLVDKGLVRRRFRRGTFVSDARRDAVTATGTAEHVGHYVEPRQRRLQVVRFGLIDSQPGQMRAWQQVIDEFETRNLGSRVEIKPLAPDRPIHAEVLSKGVDVYQLAALDAHHALDQGLLQGWGSVEQDEAKSAIQGLFPWTVQPCVSGGQLLAIPTGCFVHVRVLNTGLIERLGWERPDAPDPDAYVGQLCAAGRRVAQTGRQDVWPTVLGIPLILAEANGASLYGLLDGPFDYGSGAWRATLEQVWRLSEGLPWTFPFAGATAGQPRGFWDRCYGGQVGAFLGLSVRLARVEAMPWSAAVLPLPLAEGAVPARVTMALAVNPQGPDPALARRFARFVAGPEAQHILARHGVCVPSRQDVACSGAFLDGPRSCRRPLLSQAQAGREMLGPGVGLRAMHAFNESVFLPLLHAMIMHERSIEETTVQLTRRHEAFLTRSWS